MPPTYLCIDLKSFYASVECVARGRDPFKTNLVVADASRGKGAICLAVSPALKALGVRNRCRLFEIPAGIDYIAALPFSCIKIDKTILWEADKGRRQLAFIYGINDLIHRLGLKSLCEGAETDEHINLLRNMKIDMIQGYYYSKPLTASQLADYRGKMI